MHKETIAILSSILAVLAAACIAIFIAIIFEVKKTKQSNRSGNEYIECK